MMVNFFMTLIYSESIHRAYETKDIPKAPLQFLVPFNIVDLFLQEEIKREE